MLDSSLSGTSGCLGMVGSYSLAKLLSVLQRKDEVRFCEFSSKFEGLA